jgi:hypothetical protein
VFHHALSMQSYNVQWPYSASYYSFLSTLFLPPYPLCFYLLSRPPLLSWPTTLVCFVMIFFYFPSTNERKQVISVFVKLAFFTYRDDLQLHPFPWKWHNFILFFIVVVLGVLCDIYESSYHAQILILQRYRGL